MWSFYKTTYRVVNDKQLMKLDWRVIWHKQQFKSLGCQLQVLKLTDHNDRDTKVGESKKCILTILI